MMNYLKGSHEDIKQNMYLGFFDELAEYEKIENQKDLDVPTTFEVPIHIEKLEDLTKPHYIKEYSKIAVHLMKKYLRKEKFIFEEWDVTVNTRQHFRDSWGGRIFVNWIVFFTFKKKDNK